MMIKVEYRDGEEVVTVTWTGEYGFQMAGKEALLQRFTVEEVAPRASLGKAAHDVVALSQMRGHRFDAVILDETATYPDEDAPRRGSKQDYEPFQDPVEDLSEEERQARQEAQAAFDRALSEAGDPDEDAADLTVDPEPDVKGDGPTPAAMPQKRKRRQQIVKCAACSHAWHTSECTVEFKDGNNTVTCGCMTAVS